MFPHDSSGNLIANALNNQEMAYTCMASLSSVLMCDHAAILGEISNCIHASVYAYCSYI